MSPVTRVSRRDLGRAAAAAIAGMTTPPADPRVADLEKAHGSPLGDALRDAVRSKLDGDAQTAAALRRIPLADGGHDPAPVYLPRLRR